VPVYFLPDSSLSHSLIGVSPLIRPQGRCVFNNSSCQLFDSPQSSVPFLQGSKTPDSDLWFLQVPPPPLLTTLRPSYLAFRNFPVLGSWPIGIERSGHPPYLLFLMLSPLNTSLSLV
jgi:hypothetical protein